MREQRLQVEKAHCGGFQQVPYYGDSHTQGMSTDRYHRPRTGSGTKTSDDAPPMPFPLHGIKASPSCRHEDRVLTLEDSAEFFDLVFQAGTDEHTMKALVSFIRAL